MIPLSDSSSQFAKGDLSTGIYELYIFSQIIDDSYSSDGFQGFPKSI